MCDTIRQLVETREHNPFLGTESITLGSTEHCIGISKFDNVVGILHLCR